MNDAQSPRVPVVARIGELATAFDAFILDLWGIVHDGTQAYPDAPETLRRIKEAGKTTIMLSNAPRRAAALIDQLEGFGIPRALYTDVLSSGEAVHEELKTRRDPFYAALGAKCHHLGPERDRNIFQELDFTLTKPEEADFILNTGPWDFDETVDDYAPVLEAGIRRGIPMVCANPDKVVIRQGVPVVCAGAIAERYEEMGGTVSYRGKPDPAIYHRCVERLGVPAEKVCVVGDAFETDVKGATAAGLASIWCTGGVHAGELGIKHGELADQDKVDALANRFDMDPIAAIPAFRW